MHTWRRCSSGLSSSTSTWELALEFRLPLRMVSPATERYVGFPASAVAATEGAVFTDHFRLVPGVGPAQIFERDLATLRPG